MSTSPESRSTDELACTFISQLWLRSGIRREDVVVDMTPRALERLLGFPDDQQDSLARSAFERAIKRAEATRPDMTQKLFACVTVSDIPEAPK